MPILGDVKTWLASLLRSLANRLDPPATFTVTGLSDNANPWTPPGGTYTVTTQSVASGGWSG